MCSGAEHEGEVGVGEKFSVGVRLVVGVDPQLERHSTGKLVSFTSFGDVVGLDLALDVDVLIDGDVKELNGNQRLRVVHLSFLAIVRVVH